MGDFLDLVWILVLLQVFIPLLQQRMQAARRLMAIRTIEGKRKSRVIAHIMVNNFSRFARFEIPKILSAPDCHQAPNG